METAAYFFYIIREIIFILYHIVIKHTGLCLAGCFNQINKTNTNPAYACQYTIKSIIKESCCSLVLNPFMVSCCEFNNKTATFNNFTGGLRVQGGMFVYANTHLPYTD